MRKLISTISFLIAINTCLISQVSIDFCPKALTGELKKICGSDKIDMTEVKLPSDQIRNIGLGRFFSLPETMSTLGVKYVYVGRVNTCRTGGCSITVHEDLDQTKEYFDYYILYSANAIIRNVKIFNYQSTYGQEVTARSWLKQFASYDGKVPLVVGKNVDAISGATISVDATSFDIESKTKVLLRILNL